MKSKFNTRLYKHQNPAGVDVQEGRLGRTAYPGRAVLDPSSSHLLLVDDVHQFDGVVAFDVNHGPLQRILGDLVQLRSTEQENIRTHRLTPSMHCRLLFFSQTLRWKLTSILFYTFLLKCNRDRKKPQKVLN